VWYIIALLHSTLLLCVRDVAACGVAVVRQMCCYARCRAHTYAPSRAAGGPPEEPLTITSSFAPTRTRWTHYPKTLSTRGDGGAMNSCEKVTCMGALLCALLPREFFLRAGLRAIQHVTACGAAAAVRDEFFCARGCV
jgi:hypothetical protein